MSSVVSSSALQHDLLGRLYDRCPLVFRGWVGADAGVPPLCREIECGPGWCALIEVLFEAVEEGARQRVHAGLPPRLAPAPLQIKERHGLLRVHLYHPAPWTAALVDVAVQRSASLCVHCGAEVRRPSGWRITEPARCARHLVSTAVTRWPHRRRVNVAVRRP